jgi:hypothetical protein
MSASDLSRLSAVGNFSTGRTARIFMMQFAREADLRPAGIMAPPTLKIAGL